MITALMRVKIGGYFFSEARFDKYEIKDSSLLFTNIRFGGDESAWVLCWFLDDKTCGILGKQEMCLALFIQGFCRIATSYIFFSFLQLQNFIHTLGS